MLVHVQSSVEKTMSSSKVVQNSKHRKISRYQEPFTRSVQLIHVSAMAFSHIDLNLLKRGLK